MPTEQFELPTGEVVIAMYGSEHPGLGTTYLNTVRMKAVDEDSPLALEYRNLVGPKFSKILKAEVGAANFEFDAVVSPPSSRSDALPYRLAINAHRGAHDLTANFSRRGEVRIGANDTTMKQAVAELSYSPDGTEAAITSLLIVDDVLASGRTVAAIVHHLLDAGMHPDCAVGVATWAKIAIRWAPA